jgi:hypothetical protein
LYSPAASLYQWKKPLTAQRAPHQGYYVIPDAARAAP